LQHKFDFLCSAHYINAAPNNQRVEGSIMATPFETLNDSSKEFIASAMKSVSALTQGLQTIANEAADYSKKSFEESSVLIEKLASIKSPEQAFETQSVFSKKAYEAFVAQATKFGELYADLAKEAYKPYETAVAKVAK
jgi:phasin family protein